jgi:hypothetical protein
VDAARGTPEHLAHHLALFDPRIVALTGTGVELAEAARAFRVVHRRVPLEGGDCTMDHAASVFLLDAQGRLAGTIDVREPSATAVEKRRLLLAPAASRARWRRLVLASGAAATTAPRPRPSRDADAMAADEGRMRKAALPLCR